MKTEKKIKSIIETLDADVCGIAAVERFSEAPQGFSPTDIYAECKSVIAFGAAIPKGALTSGPGLIYSHFNGSVICSRVDEIALFAAKKIEAEYGCTVVPLPCDAPNDYWEPDNLTAKGLISMKHTAVLCGLGQLGKSTLLLNPQFGNLLTVGAVLTNLSLESDELCENICIPRCRRCIEACPVQAIGEQHVDQKLCRPNTYGKTARGFDTVKCNCCRSVCPMRFGKTSDVSQG